MSTKELAYSMIDNLTEEQLNALIVSCKDFRKKSLTKKQRKSLTKPKRVKISLVRLIR